MNSIRFTKRFLAENPLMELSPALLTHLRMETVTIPEFNDKLNELIISKVEKSRYEQYQAEKEHIINLNAAEDIVLYMKKVKEPLNSSLLIQKAIEYQDDVIPLVLKKICTSGHAVFIENTAMLIANADIKYTEQLYAVFSNIRNAYARSELCIVFGVKKKAEYTQLLIEQFKRIKQERPDKHYEQGPLLALHLIYGKVQ